MSKTLLDTLITVLGFEVDDKGLKDAGKKLKETKETLDKAAGSIAIGGAVLSAALTGVGKNVLDFEREMNALRAATNATDDDMGRLRKQAKKLGRETSFSASQAAQAQTELGKAGYDTQKIIATMPGVLALAAAGQLSMGEAAAITTSVMASYNFSADESARVSDVLAASASSAKTTVSEMGFAMSKAAPIANSLGVSLEDTASMLATLQNNGLEASVAGTGLKTVMLRLVKPSKEASDAMAAMGVSIERIKKLAQEGKVIEIMAELGRKNIDAANASAIFGMEAASQAMILANSAKNIDELKISLEGAGGAAQRMADQQMDGLPGAAAMINSKFEGLLLTLGDAGITGALLNAADALGWLLDKFNSAPPLLQKIIAFTITLGPILLGLAGILKMASFAVGVFNAMIFANPVGLFVAAIAGLVVALSALAFFWDDIVSSFSKGFDFIKGILNGVKGFLGHGNINIDHMAKNTAPQSSIMPGGSSSVNTQTNSVAIDNITIDAKGGDSREIAQNVGGALRDQMQNTVQNFDGSFAR